MCFTMQKMVGSIMPIMDGFIWLRGEMETAWFWNEQNQWVWTGENIYPHLYRHRDAAWLYFFKQALPRLYFTTIQLKNSKDLPRNENKIYEISLCWLSVFSFSHLFSYAGPPFLFQANYPCIAKTLRVLQNFHFR